jgi:DNA-binding IclR family transcriptional regulator
LAVQREGTKSYALGPLAFELGLAAAASYDLREQCQSGMRQLAEELGDTVYLSVRSGTESVCQAREEGPSPIRVNTLSIGSRRPLGLGAGGLAILSHLPFPEFEDVMAHILPRVQTDADLDERTLRAAVAETRRKGYAFIRNRVTLGVTAIGVPIFDSLDRPIAAISIAAIDERMRADRIPTLAASLQQQALLMGRSASR